MIVLDTFGLALAATLAFAVWGPDMWRWIASHLGNRPPENHNRRRFGFD
jgi:hypothetical protein